MPAYAGIIPLNTMHIVGVIGFTLIRGDDPCIKALLNPLPLSYPHFRGYLYCLAVIKEIYKNVCTIFLIFI